MIPCHLGIETEYNPEGKCCCNCKWQRPISGHPWNTGEFKSKVSEIIGYGCTIPEMDNIMLMQRQHSLCEMYETKEN